MLPETAEQVAAVVTECARAGVPFVARGSGTGLSGGALPRTDGVLIVTSRMRRIIAIDPVSQRAIVEPGVTNLAVSTAARPFGYFYAPDPSSQVVCSVGGNVAENSGGAHCLKHGFTVHHVTGLQIVTPAGELTWLGDGTGAAPGYDLVGAFTGSEGTLGIVTKIVVRLTRIPQVVTTLLAAFATTGAGGAAVSAIIGAGILPAAIEMMDALAIEAAEAAVACHYPAGAGAVLIVELDGPEADVRRDVRRGAGAVRAGRRDRDPGGGRPGRAGRDLGGPQVRVRRRGPDQLGLHRAGRRGAADRAGRGAGPDRRAVRRRPASGWPTCSTPGTATCTRWCCTTTPSPGEAEAAEEVSGAILDLCIEHGGSITGEHGVGVGQGQVHAEDVQRRRPGHHAAAALRVRPGRAVQPGQDLPDAAAVRRGARRRAAAVHPLVAAGQAEQF